MNKEMRELLNKLEIVQNEAKELMNKEDVKAEEINAKTDEIKALKAKVEALNQIDDDLQGGMEIMDKVQKPDVNNAFINALRGKATTEEMEVLNALTKGVPVDGGLIVPPDYDAKIREYMREYKAAKSLVGTHSTTVTTGTLIYEDLSTITPLADMTEMTDLTEQQPKFKNLTYTVKDYGALLPISNTLLQDEQGELMEYVGRWFAKKDVRTQNTKIFTALGSAKAKKAIADWKALGSVLNKDLDPMVAANAVIITNQDGFDFLDAALDLQGRPVLQPDPTNPTVMRFKGRVLHVFSNAELPTTGTTTKKAPIFVGAMEEACKFVDRRVFEMATSKEFGFGKNATYVRCIDRFDIIVSDVDAYINGEITVLGA